MVALFVALTGTATAGITLIVTGANIKNGTIQAVDLTAVAKRAHKGQSGPGGAPGPAGVPRPPELPVRRGPHYRTGELTVPPGEVDGFGMTCPSGEGIISGGEFASMTHVGARKLVPLARAGGAVTIRSAS
jgi:hypothetical protein